jgi:hypothetical protein
MMPAMSPLMTEGKIIRWKIKEGDAFASGDVLLQIVKQIFTAFSHKLKLLVCLQESEIATIDVEALNPGILGKILVSPVTSLPELKVTLFFCLVAGRIYKRPCRTSHRTCRKRYVRTRSIAALINSNTIPIPYYSDS